MLALLICWGDIDVTIGAAIVGNGVPEDVQEVTDVRCKHRAYTSEKIDLDRYSGHAKTLNKTNYSAL
jgi:hypothetical protein